MTAKPSGPPTSSVLAALEKDLRNLWVDPAKPQTGGPQTRVCTMNLVVVGARDITERYTPVVDEVCSSVLSRAIVVTLDPESPIGVLQGDVSAVGVREGDPTSGSERIRLTASGSVCARVASAVETLLVSEVPTTLIWLGRVHTDDPVFLSLADAAHRVLLDTEYTSLTSLLHLARWVREDPDRPHLADLAWTRLSPWQEMCARFFDEPRLREFANCITRVSIQQASEAGARLGSEGALLLGWLATRLGWKVSRLGGALRFKRADGAAVAVSLGVVPRPDGVAPAALAGVAIEAKKGDVAVKGSIERDLASGPGGHSTTDADVVLWKLVTEDKTIEQRTRLSANKGAKVLERTLHRPADDPALTESVTFAETVFEDGINCG